MTEYFYIPLLIGLVFAFNHVYALFSQERTGVRFMDKYYTTVLKGLAILFIIVGHCSSLWVGARLINPLGSIGVSLFLIASGFGLNESFKAKGLQAFWRKRIVRVWLPYALLVVGFFSFMDKSLSRFFLELFCIESYYWFIPYILGCYIVFWTLSRFFCRWRITLLGIISLLSLYFLSYVAAEQAFGLITGVLLSEHISVLREKAKDYRKYRWTLLLLFLIGLFFLGLKQLPVVRTSSAFLFNVVNMLVKIPISLSIVGCLFFFRKMVFNPFVEFSGKISYELYLVHFPFYTFIGAKFWPALVLISSSYFISWGFYKFNNRLTRLLIEK